MTALRRFGLLAPLAAFSLAGCGLNSVPTAEENVNAKWGNVQNEYQRRADLVPNLVNTVKGYAQQEKSVLTEVTEARAKASSIQLNANDLDDPAKVKQFQDAQQQLGGSLGRLLATLPTRADSVEAVYYMIETNLILDRPAAACRLLTSVRAPSRGTSFEAGIDRFLADSELGCANRR